jgi:hypothetical protein
MVQYLAKESSVWSRLGLIIEGEVPSAWVFFESFSLDSDWHLLIWKRDTRR